MLGKEQEFATHTLTIPLRHSVPAQFLLSLDVCHSLNDRGIVFRYVVPAYGEGYCWKPNGAIRILGCKPLRPFRIAPAGPI